LAPPRLKERTEILQWSNYKALFIGGGGTISRMRDRLREKPGSGASRLNGASRVKLRSEEK